MGLYEVVSNQPAPYPYGGKYRNGSIVGFKNRQWEVSISNGEVTLKRPDEHSGEFIELPIIKSSLLRVYKY